MKRHSLKTGAVIAIVAAIAVMTTVSPRAYVTFGRWPSGAATVYINPANNDGLSDSAVISAIQAGMNDWMTQGGSPFKFNYGGQVKDTAITYDNRNVVLFRNETNGGLIANTYYWIDASGNLVDSDMVIYDVGYTYYAFDGTCDSTAGYGVYIHDLTTHEFGHMLGLAHSSDPSATMAYGYAPCSTTQRTLELDDISGIQAIYGKASSGGNNTPPSNTAPSVSISSPGNTASFSQGSLISFAGSATDTQDGNLTSAIVWTSNIDGSIGGGGSFSRTLSAGTHTITASVTDSGGMSGSRSVTITVVAATPSSSTSGASLSARGYKAKGLQKVDLSWSGLSAGQTDIYRNNVRVTTTSNSGKYTDNIGTRGGGSYSYTACDAGTSTCSNSAAVSF